MKGPAPKDALTRSAMAKQLGVKVRQLDNLVAEGLPRLETLNGWRYDAATCLAWYHDFKKRRQVSVNGNGKRREMDDELAALRLRRERLELERFEGTMVDLPFVQEWQRQLLDRLRAKMVPFPGKLAGRMIGLRTYGAALTAIKPLWDQLLDQLAQTGHEIARDFGADGHARAGRRGRRAKSQSA